MLWAGRWRRFTQWFEQLPLWVQVVVAPPIAPPVLAVAAACLCPRTAVAAGTAVVVTWGILLRADVVAWADVGRQVGWMYLGLVAAGYLGMVEMASRRAFRRLFPAQPTDASPDAAGSHIGN